MPATEYSVLGLVAHIYGLSPFDHAARTRNSGESCYLTSRRAPGVNDRTDGTTTGALRGCLISTGLVATVHAYIVAHPAQKSISNRAC